MHSTISASMPGRQKGATLVIALLVLVLIMMIGITAVSTSDTQYKLAGNVQFEDSALNNAETAVSAAERWLSTATNFGNPAFIAPEDPAAVDDPGSEVGTPQLLPRTSVASFRAARVTRPFSMTWADTNSLAVDPAGAQRYYIELMSLNNRLQGSSQRVGGRGSSGCNQVNTYLITARGVSARGATKTVQSFYSVLNCP